MLMIFLIHRAPYKYNNNNNNITVVARICENKYRSRQHHVVVVFGISGRTNCGVRVPGAQRAVRNVAAAAGPYERERAPRPELPYAGWLAGWLAGRRIDPGGNTAAVQSGSENPTA